MPTIKGRAGRSARRSAYPSGSVRATSRRWRTATCARASPTTGSTASGTRPRHRGGVAAGDEAGEPRRADGAGAGPLAVLDPDDQLRLDEPRLLRRLAAAERARAARQGLQAGSEVVEVGLPQPA